VKRCPASLGLWGQFTTLRNVFIVAVFNNHCATYLCILYVAQRIPKTYNDSGGECVAKRKAEWQNNYIAKVYDRVNLTLPKGKKETLQSHASDNGESLNGFINRAVDETMSRDQQKEPP
jgi:hypothetical protein